MLRSRIHALDGGESLMRFRVGLTLLKYALGNLYVFGRVDIEEAQALGVKLIDDFGLDGKDFHGWEKAYHALFLVL